MCRYDMVYDARFVFKGLLERLTQVMARVQEGSGGDDSNRDTERDLVRMIRNVILCA